MPVEPIKAIETRYKGFRFRSRVEARCAVFFDALNLDWDYEAEGYDLGGAEGRYLPDFFMRSNGHYGPYVEIKGKKPTTAEIDKLLTLCGLKTAYGTFLFGSIRDLKWIDIHKDGFVYREGNLGDLAECQIFLGALAYPNHAPAIPAALNRANSARFEHGEKP